MFGRGRMIFFVILMFLLYKLYDQVILSIYASEQGLVKLKTENDLNETISVKLDPCKCYRSFNASRTTRNEANLDDATSLSTCSSWAAAREPSQNVVSFSLFGHFPGEYSNALEKQLSSLETAYPNWIVRLYLDLSGQNIRKWACSVACKRNLLDLCDIKQIPGIGDISKCKGSIWRFLVMGDPLVERYIIRDLDSPIIQREVDATLAWIKSGKCFHVMRDNIHHGVPMMAGMWGGCNTWNLSTFITARQAMISLGTKGQSDQQVLSSQIWPKIQKSVLIHDSYTCEIYPGSLPYPTQRLNYTFIGMRTFRKEFVKDRVYPKCPVSCRPKGRQDWEYC